MQIGFNGSERSTLGVEVELQIIDRDTWGLSSGASAILAAIGGEVPGGHPKVKHELMQSNLELVTGVCETVAEAGRILDHGPSYLRQRRLVVEGASLADVVAGLVDELQTDRPGG
jgi:carboxylate-amine ligase